MQNTVNGKGPKGSIRNAPAFLTRLVDQSLKTVSRRTRLSGNKIHVIAHAHDRRFRLR